MGTSERKEREKEQKKLLILESAEELILEKGLDHLNMDEVAERAEVSKGSLYHYFKNKTDLVLGICNKATNMLSGQISDVLIRDLPGIEMVYTIGATFLNFVRSHPEFFRSMRFFDNLKDTDQLGESEYIEMCQSNMDTSFTSMVRAIQIGMQDGSINDSYDAKELAVLLWSTSHGMVNLAYLHQNTPHFHLLEKNKVEMNSLFEGYMKLIGCGIATDESKKDIDSKSIFETESK
ncbi:MAG: TetR/AcrR family transcriptional regulator [Gracilimonas sp.]|uniref:TetR/AcrR family transcriptional regulator n=1 Tax=Gracilimonas TaxID=649462 RepID=UPI001B081F86|nr:TetR/AcrR family transcriptional regulator [Gracilimonas sp.]MBO6585157.1 TetR/AcrR family transcriptional regulator [Gracilimonas sp.]MBO6615571.1 TetR/AcrR family transcriptional regulator [Gracilimonas sp.]